MERMSHKADDFLTPVMMFKIPETLRQLHEGHFPQKRDIAPDFFDFADFATVI